LKFCYEENQETPAIQKRLLKSCGKRTDKANEGEADVFFLFLIVPEEEARQTSGSLLARVERARVICNFLGLLLPPEVLYFPRETTSAWLADG